MMSLSRPKRMHFLGSDGYKYRFLSKPNDDLRRDMRVMEYANLLNRLFADDPATGRRGMRVCASNKLYTLPLHCHSLNHPHKTFRT
jgi:serine/threonine-protein kinase ATR